jgi:hypothetical protein
VNGPRYMRVTRNHGPIVHRAVGILAVTECGIKVGKDWWMWMPRKRIRWGDLVGRQCKRCYA